MPCFFHDPHFAWIVSFYSIYKQNIGYDFLYKMIGNKLQLWQKNDESIILIF